MEGGRRQLSGEKVDVFLANGRVGEIYLMAERLREREENVERSKDPRLTALWITYHWHYQ